MSPDRATPETPRGGPVSPPGLPRRVLVVDDNSINRFMLSQYVTQMGHRTIMAEDGRQALASLEADPCDLVLLDVMMPEMDGHAVLEHLKKSARLREIPVIVVSGLEEIQTAARCIEAGAEDYLTKPFDPVLLRARITASLEKKRLRDQEAEHLAQLLELKRALAERNAALEVANQKLEKAAFTDVLTGLPNRRFAMDQLGQLWVTAGRYGQPLSCLIVDVDHFKKINDSHGHDRGDLVLRSVADVLRHAARSSDAVCRLGGEEFVVLCPMTDLDAAATCAERLRIEVAAHEVRDEGFSHRVTISIGVATRTVRMANMDDLLKAADQAVYAAKGAGRDRVCMAEPDLTSP